MECRGRGPRRVAQPGGVPPRDEPPMWTKVRAMSVRYGNHGPNGPTQVKGAGKRRAAPVAKTHKSPGIVQRLLAGKAALKNPEDHAAIARAEAKRARRCERNLRNQGMG